MAKEKVFIVLSHKHSLKKDKNGKGVAGEWEVAETVEFVDQLRKRHTSTASVIADYLNKKIIIGSRVGMGDYNSFDNYIRKKYARQMSELDAAYGKEQIEDKDQSNTEVFVDSFGNLRPKTVFDV